MAKEVLIVDDQPGIRLLLEEVVKGEGYAVACAETGREALDYIEANDPSLLVVDYNLPVMNGGELLHHLNETGYDKPAILMTGLSVESLGEEKNFHFVKKVVSKPFNIMDIRELITKIMQ
ncbi:two-component system, response regulator, stage 0 sporulation protein F [Thalassobacillus cyri]|uniref:Two-component system, response regulator, stage 0 sporulation protein F n=1 Tax=Thalassobacillus cyri TaxID=571932 RepID=A0A1H4DCE1_9BACI|nr:response regulator [Thalassobacillus cyri]SEA70425.1 two-component system, response regulator, stage 0 sporulation protein F [Thalassobacillus cyri]